MGKYIYQEEIINFKGISWKAHQTTETQGMENEFSMMKTFFRYLYLYIHLFEFSKPCKCAGREINEMPFSPSTKHTIVLQSAACPCPSEMWHVSTATRLCNKITTGLAKNAPSRWSHTKVGRLQTTWLTQGRKMELTHLFDWAGHAEHTLCCLKWHCAFVIFILWSQRLLTQSIGNTKKDREL